MSPSKPRVLSLSEVADRLNMKRPNVAKFLARREVEPAFSKAQGYFWWESDIERVRLEREADATKMDADCRRRESALGGRAEPVAPLPPELARLGESQKRLAAELLRRPVRPAIEADRFALRRLRGRGLAERVEGEPGLWTATALLRRLAEFL